MNFKEIYSYNKEQAGGHSANNLITVIKVERKVRLQEAFDVTGQTLRYVTGLECWVSGSLEWSLSGPGYFGSSVEEVRRTRRVALAERYAQGPMISIRFLIQLFFVGVGFLSCVPPNATPVRFRKANHDKSTGGRSCQPPRLVVSATKCGLTHRLGLRTFCTLNTLTVCNGDNALRAAFTPG